MKLNKTQFMESPIGISLKDCISEWDVALDVMEMSEVDSDEYRMALETTRTCMAEWGVYQILLEYLSGIEFHVKRRDYYVGVVSADEDEWLFKILR